MVRTAKFPKKDAIEFIDNQPIKVVKQQPIAVRKYRTRDATTENARIDDKTKKLLKATVKSGAPAFHIAPQESDPRELVKRALAETKKRKAEKYEAIIKRRSRPHVPPRPAADMDYWALPTALNGRGKPRVVTKTPQSKMYPALPLPLPGQSYRPDYNEHQDALALAVAARERYLKQEDDLREGLELEVKFARSKQFYPRVDTNDPWVEDEEEGEGKEKQARVVRRPPRRRTERELKLKEKKKEIRRREIRYEQAARTEAALDNVEEISRQLDISTERAALKKAYFGAEKARKRQMTAQIGDYPKHEEVQPAVYTTDELPKRMLSVKHAYNPFLEIWDSWARRNLHENKNNHLKAWKIMGFKHSDFKAPPYKKHYRIKPGPAETKPTDAPKPNADETVQSTTTDSAAVLGGNGSEKTTRSVKKRNRGSKGKGANNPFRR